MNSNWIVQATSDDDVDIVIVDVATVTKNYC